MVVVTASYSIKVLCVDDKYFSPSFQNQRDPPLGPLHPKPISTGHQVSLADPMAGGMALDEPDGRFGGSDAPATSVG